MYANDAKMIQTQDYVQAMTAREYACWVERGEFPPRLEKMRAEYRRSRARKNEARRAERRERS